MRAAIVRSHGTPDSLAVETLPDPAPARGEVVVRIEAVAANFVDLLVISGGYQFLPGLPFIPGKLPAGTIVAVGENAGEWQAGDRVQTLAEHGGYASRIAVPAAACIRLPDAMSFTAAAAMGLAYDTAWFAIHERARAATGETMLVLGASGGVGLAAIQFGKACGLRVLAGVSNSHKRALVLAAGADVVIDLAVPDLRDGLRQQVHDVTAGRGADIVLDMLGDDFFDAAIRVVAWRGRLVVVGFAAGRIPTLKVNYVLLKNIEVSGLQISDYRRRRPDLIRHCYSEIFRLFAEGRLHAPPTTTFSLERVTEALHKLKERQVSGRIVLLPSDGAA
jgi:NADPH2:quinone reductase